MKYFDNAATSWPKPEAVYLALDEFFRRAGSPGRGAHSHSLAASRTVFAARTQMAAMLGVSHAERLVFTPGCTYAVNFALRGFGLQAGDLVLTSPCEHNAVARTLEDLIRQSGIKVEKLPYSSQSIINPDDLQAAVKNTRPKLCVFTEASNVTGALLDIEKVASICRESKVPLAIDAAQSAGLTNTSFGRIEELGINLWCASGHKNLMGPFGVGLLYVSPDTVLKPLITGGTGSASDELLMPEFYPDHLEAGTLPYPEIAGLSAAFSWLSAEGMEKICRHKEAICARFIGWLSGHDEFEVFGPAEKARRTALVSFRHKNISCDRIADILDREFGMAVRPGLHCALWCHQALGTAETGLVRASFGYFTSETEVDELCRALDRLQKVRP